MGVGVISAIVIGGGQMIIQGVQDYFQYSEDYDYHNQILDAQKETLELEKKRISQANIDADLSSLWSTSSKELDQMFKIAEDYQKDKEFPAAIEVYSRGLDRIAPFIQKVEREIADLESQITRVANSHADTTQLNIQLVERKHALRSLEKIKFRFIFQRAMIHLYEWDYELAARDLSEAIRLNTDLGIHRFSLYGQRAIAQLRGNLVLPNTPNPSEDFQKFLDSQPDDMLIRGRLEFAKKHFQNAIQIFEPRARGAQFDSILLEEIEEYLGDAYFALKQDEEAINHYQFSLREVMKLPSCQKKQEALHVKIGNLFCEMQDKEREAIEHYSLAYEINPLNPLKYLVEAKRGDCQRQFQIGKAYLGGSFAIPKEIEKGINWLNQAAEKRANPLGEEPKKHRIWAIYQLGLYYLGDEQGGRPNPALGLEKIERAFRSSKLSINEKEEGYMRLGQFYLQGARGLGIDFVQAEKYLKLAADSQTLSQEKISEASYQIGLIYLNGQGAVLKNLPDALKYLKVVADSPMVSLMRKIDAAKKIGELYENGGEGLEISFADAIKYYTQIADNVNTPDEARHDAEVCAGRVYFKRDYLETAEHYLNRSVAAGYSGSWTLGKVYFALAEKEQDLKKAYIYYAKSIEVGYGKEILELLGYRLNHFINTRRIMFVSTNCGLKEFFLLSEVAEEKRKKTWFLLECLGRGGNFYDDEADQFNCEIRGK